jgi:hypothetical protein
MQRYDLVLTHTIITEAVMETSEQNNHSKNVLITELCIGLGARSDVIVWGIMLQVGKERVRFPMRSLDFSIDLMLPEISWSWCRLYL